MTLGKSLHVCNFPSLCHGTIPNLPYGLVMTQRNKCMLGFWDHAQHIVGAQEREAMLLKKFFHKKVIQARSPGPFLHWHSMIFLGQHSEKVSHLVRNQCELHGGWDAPCLMSLSHEHVRNNRHIWLRESRSCASGQCHLAIPGDGHEVCRAVSSSGFPVCRKWELFL